MPNQRQRPVFDWTVTRNRDVASHFGRVFRDIGLYLALALAFVLTATGLVAKAFSTWIAATLRSACAGDVLTPSADVMPPAGMMLKNRSSGSR